MGALLRFDFVVGGQCPSGSLADAPYSSTTEARPRDYLRQVRGIRERCLRVETRHLLLLSMTGIGALLTFARVTSNCSNEQLVAGFQALGMSASFIRDLSVRLVLGEDGYKDFKKEMAPFAAAGELTKDAAVRTVEQLAAKYGLSSQDTKDLKLVAGVTTAAIVAAIGSKGTVAGVKVPGRVQSRINVSNDGWTHVLDRHFNPDKNASQFTISQGELRALLQSRSVIATPVIRIIDSAEGPRYIREVNFGYAVGVDKFNSSRPTSIMTIMSDGAGNLITATPGVIK